VRGGVLPIGSGRDPDFTPVELLLAALAGCTAIDVGLITGKRAQPDSFDVHVDGHKVRDDDGSHLVDLTVTVAITFPAGAAGDAARDVLPRSIQQTADRLCTVGRTLQLGTSIDYRQE
jgi:putative redox protein